MALRDDSSWVVLKFGGTSVSNLANWRNIAAVVRSRLAAGTRVLVVHSAISGITDRLETLLAAALARACDGERRAHGYRAGSTLSEYPGHRGTMVGRTPLTQCRDTRRGIGAG